MQATPLEAKILGMIEPSLTGMGYAVVRLRMREGSQKGVLEVLAERVDEAGMSIDDCVEISHTVSALLEVNDPINGQYDLEVSSPGLDRPLVKPEDFNRFKGSEAKVELMLSLDGRKRFRGVIEGMSGQDVRMTVEGTTAVFKFTNIRSAKLAVTEEKVKADFSKKKKKKVG